MSRKSPNPIDKFVGQRIRMARLLAKMSQEKLGDALGLTFQQVQKYEKGANRVGASRMQQIATIPEKPVAWFFDEKNAKTPGADLVSEMLVLPYGLELAQHYIAIAHNNDRRTVVEVAAAMSRVPDDPTAAERQRNRRSRLAALHGA